LGFDKQKGFIGNFIHKVNHELKKKFTIIAELFLCSKNGLVLQVNTFLIIHLYHFNACD